jgi:phage baseplate assembly protein W
MHLVFQPITVYTGQQIAQVIAMGLTSQEPRIKVENVHCTGFPDTNEYGVTIKASIPGIKNTRLGIGGSISVNGISLTNVENESIY